MLLKVSSRFLRSVDRPVSFHVLFKNKRTGKRNLALARNKTISPERLEEIEEREGRGEELFVFEGDLEDFCAVFGHKDEILEMNRVQLTLRDKESQARQRFESEYGDPDRKVLDLVAEARKSSDLSGLVGMAKAEIESFTMTESVYFSTLRGFCSFTLSRVGELSQGAAFCFYLAKRLDVEIPLDLLEIVCAYSLRELGYAFLKPGKERLEDPDYVKYPMFSQYILGMAKAPFSKNVARYILEHREKYDQSGFPRGKGEAHTHFHSYIVGGAHELFEIFFRQFKGKDFNAALGEASRGRGAHPQVASTIYSFKR